MDKRTTPWKMLQYTHTPTAEGATYITQECRLVGDREEHQIVLSDKKPSEPARKTWGEHPLPSAYQAAIVFNEYYARYKSERVQCEGCSKTFKRVEMTSLGSKFCKACAKHLSPF